MNQTKDITEFSKELEQQMKSRLEAVHQEVTDMEVRSIQSVHVVSNALEALREFVLGYPFQTAKEEISFFKEIKPIFLTQYYYQRRLGELIKKEPVHLSRKMVYFTKQLRKIYKFQQEHVAFDQYSLTGSTSMDDRYFKRGNMEIVSVLFDRQFSTYYDDVLSQLNASRLLKQYLSNEIHQLNPEEGNPESPLSWTGSKADLIELIYGLETMGALNKGNADIKEIATMFERAFNISLGNYYRQFLDIRLRKKSKTTFLDEMKSKLEARINDFG